MVTTRLHFKGYIFSFCKTAGVRWYIGVRVCVLTVRRAVAWGEKWLQSRDTIILSRCVWQLSYLPSPQTSVISRPDDDDGDYDGRVLKLQRNRTTKVAAHCCSTNKLCGKASAGGVSLLSSTSSDWWLWSSNYRAVPRTGKTHLRDDCWRAVATHRTLSVTFQ